MASRLQDDRDRGNILGRPSKGYIPALDGLRALAVAVVMLSHVPTPGFSGGKTGVLVFFVLSGYLITSILLKELARTDRVQFGKFYIRRFLRLFPAMITVVLVTAGISLVLVMRSGEEVAAASLRAIPSVVVYANNWVPILWPGSEMGLFGHFWSLAVEEQFYLVWPLLLVIVYRWKQLKGVAWFAVGGAILSIVNKTLLWDGGGARQGGTDFAADGLLVGCALAAWLAMEREVLTKTARWLFWPAIAGLTVATVMGKSSNADPEAYILFGRFFWPITVISAAIVIYGLVTNSAPGWFSRMLSSGPFVFVGRISYGMYLWHILVLAVLHQALGSKPLIVVLMFVGTIAVATASFYLIERPALRLKSRFETVREGREVDAAQFGT